MKKVIFISSEGGHLDELTHIDFSRYDYHIVTEKTKTTEGLQYKYKDKVDYLAYGTRKTKFKYFFILLFNTIKSLKLLNKYKPDVIVTTGTHTAVPMCYLAYKKKIKVIWIETYANRYTKTMAGSMVYKYADVFIVQWEEMKKLYPNAICLGSVY